jgi:hypothetical protein
MFDKLTSPIALAFLTDYPTPRQPRCLMRYGCVSYAATALTLSIGHRTGSSTRWLSCHRRCREIRASVLDHPGLDRGAGLIHEANPCSG